MIQKRGCANPSCRKIYNVIDDNNPYCSDKCRDEVESQKNIYTTLSIRKDFKKKLRSIKDRIFRKYEIDVSYSNILIAIVSILEKQGKIVENIMKEIELIETMMSEKNA